MILVKYIPPKCVTPNETKYYVPTSIDNMAKKQKTTLILPILLSKDLHIYTENVRSTVKIFGKYTNMYNTFDLKLCHV